MGPVILTLACAAPAVPALVRLGEAGASKVIALADAAGCAGLAAYALAIVLAARLRPVESLFVGLDRVYRSHHRVAIAALALLCAHPLLLALARPAGDTRRAFLSAWSDPVILSGWLALLALIAGMLASGARLPHRIWRMLHVLLALAFLVGMWHLIATASWPPPGAHAALYALGGIAALATSARWLGGARPRYAYEVSRVARRDDRVVVLELTPMGPSLPHEAAQFVFASFRCRGPCDVSREFHPFTIASDAPGGAITLLVAAAGDDTRCLQRVAVGTPVILEGPYGAFARRREPRKPQLWIAGGVGIAPFVGMARTLAPSDDVVLIHAVERASDPLAGTLATPAAPAGVRPHVHAATTDGQLDSGRLRALCPDIADREVWLCGPPGLLAAMRRAAIDLGVPRWLIHAEAFA